tara:strand:- start:164 stop:499 length:336 start_codon:yes stop_codon:yes gene_type:complete
VGCREKRTERTIPAKSALFNERPFIPPAHQDDTEIKYSKERETHIITTSPHRAGTNTVNVIPSSLSPLSDQLCELDGQAPPGLASSEIGIVVVCERDLRAVSVVEYSFFAR